MPAGYRRFGVLAAIPFLAYAAWWWTHVHLREGLGTDFGFAYGAARVALEHGFGRLYDPAFQQSFIGPPPLAWLVAALAWLPFWPAFWIWSLVLLVAFVVAGLLLAPSDWWNRAAHLGVALGLFPTVVAFFFGQPVPLLLAAVALAWWLLQHARPVAAGLVLCLIALKPNLAWLVPVALFFAGQRRAAGAWLAGTVVIALVAIASLGSQGLVQWTTLLASIAARPENRDQFTVLALVPWEPAALMLVAVAIMAMVWAARRSPELAVAVGICGSLLASPYLHVQDLAMLIPAGWLLWRARPSLATGAFLATGCFLVEFAEVLGPAMPLWELAFILTVGLRLRGRAQPEEGRQPV